WVTFDPYSFFAWFVVPFLVLLVFGKIDFQWFSLKRAQKVDFVIFLGIILIGALAISLIPLFPSLSSYYESYGERALDFKLLYAKRHLIWLSCWLFPWEFLTRYVLLKSSVKLNSRWGWLFVPLFELGYHLIKPWPEAVGMLFFSLFLTIWTMRRKSLMPAFIAHLIIELELLAFLLLV
ncbi:MAG: hypothetical protein KDD55_09395, partial [Bdellovibrionales bacterium]|nr:hypothetical protein [Bdellovibrionales bacterium]